MPGINQPHSVKRGFNSSATDFDLGQPVHPAQVDLVRNVLLSVNFRHVNGQMYEYLTV